MIRERLSEARDLRGDTNADLARRLGWDIRAVTNVFCAGRPLRAATAYAVADCLRRSSPYKNIEQIDRALSDVYASPSLSPLNRPNRGWYPEAIITAYGAKQLAEFLGNALARGPGVSAVRRRQYVCLLEAALLGSRKQMAASAAYRYALMYRQERDSDVWALRMLHSWGFPPTLSLQDGRHPLPDSRPTTRRRARRAAS